MTVVKHRMNKTQPVRYSPQLRLYAYQLYMDGGFTYQQIADQLNIPANSIKQWSVYEKWSKRKNQINEELKQQYDAATQELQKADVVRVVNNHQHMRNILDKKGTVAFAVCDPIEDHKKFESYTRSLKNLASTSKITHELTTKSEDQGRRPGSTYMSNCLIQVGLRSLGRVSKPPKTIEAQAVEDDF